MHQVIETFFDFVRIPSPTGEEMQFSQYLMGRLKGLNYSVYQDDRGNLITSFGTEGEPILLAAHIDTVEPGHKIEPEITNGVCRSTGDTILGADNKAMVAVLFELAKWAGEQTGPLRKTELLFSVAEEAGTSGIETLDITQLSAKTGMCFDASFPLGTVILSSPYYVSIKLQFEGMHADASTAHKGQSVLPSLAQFLHEMPQGVVEDGVFINFGAVHGGNVANALLADIQLKGEIRCFDRDRLYHYMKQVEELASTAAKAHGCRHALILDIENGGYAVAEESTLAHIAADAWQATDDSIEMNYIDQYWGISDANNLNQRGIETINLGYGVKDPHTTRERIDEADVLRLLEMVKHLVRV